MKHAMILYQKWNKRCRRDGDEFRREAMAFAEHHGRDKCTFVPLPRYRPWDSVKRFIKHKCSANRGDRVPPLFDTIVYFGHGTRLRLPSMGVWAPGAFAAQLASCCTNDVTVILYACSAARGFGFADRLKRIMVKRYGMTGCRVLSHTTAGHTTKNPYVEDCGVSNRWRGEHLIPRGRWRSKQRELWHRWRRALKGKLRFEFPFMTRKKIIEELGGDRLDG